MTFMNDLFAGILAFFYQLVPNYGFTIIALTLTVMIVLTPLTLKGTRSMMVMQQMQPEIKKLQSKYKDDRQKLNEELLKFYKENNISPLGGCLPLLVQMPVFLFLYQALRGLTQREPSVGSNVGWVTGQSGVATALTNPPTILNPFDPAYISHDSALYQSLSSSTTMNFFGMDLAESASQALSQGILTALPYLLLIVVVGVTGFVQQKQIQGRNPSAEVNPQQQMMMKIMPVFLPVISFTLPAGLVLYFATSNLYRIGQQAFISRSIYGLKRGEKLSDKVDKVAKEDKAPAAVGAQRATKSGGAKGGSGKAGSTSSAGAAPGQKSGRGRSEAEPVSAKASKATRAKDADTKADGPGSGSRGGGGRTTGGKGDRQRSSGAQKSSGQGRTGSGGASGGSTSGPTTPALQPRARKTKKR